MTLSCRPPGRFALEVAGATASRSSCGRLPRPGRAGDRAAADESGAVYPLAAPLGFNPAQWGRRRQTLAVLAHDGGPGVLGLEPSKQSAYPPDDPIEAHARCR